LLEWLTKLRETFYLLDYQFVIKGYNSRTARWKRSIGQGMEKGARIFHVLWAAILPESLHAHQPGNSLNIVLLGSYGVSITEAWLVESLPLGD